MDKLLVLFHIILDKLLVLFQIIGEVGGIFALAGGLYLYFENRKLKLLDYKREWDVAKIKRIGLEHEKIALLEREGINELELNQTYQDKNRVPIVRWNNCAELKGRIDKFNTNIAEMRAVERGLENKVNLRILWFLGDHTESGERFSGVVEIDK